MNFGNKINISHYLCRVIFKKVMAQRKEKLLSQKHTGFEISSFHNILLGLPSLADFFFVVIFQSTDSATNEIDLLNISLKGLAFHQPFFINSTRR
jgi:hypothetical protein